MPEVKKNKKVIIIIFLILIFFSLTGIFYFKYFSSENLNISDDENLISNKDTQNEINNSIYKGNERPIAVMIDNVGDARPQSGLNKAYMVYEIIVEGEQTRLMALFKGQSLDKIGPIRSGRHYFLDYALENDAIYVHYGWSPKTKTDIANLNIDNINGMVQSSKSFWRVKDKLAPHNVVTSTEKILEIEKRLKYRKISTQRSVLNYHYEEINLENSINATNIKLPYSNYVVGYKYNQETGRYTRYNYDKKNGKMESKMQKDWETDEAITTKNIIITFIKNTKLKDNSTKNRQELLNIGTLDGYYITNGKAIKINCIKTSRREQTIYKDLNGNEIKVNNGNTFVQIVPLDAEIKIE